MENTSCGENCPYVKQGFCNNEKECPNFIETYWIENDTGNKKKINDCSPKRVLLNQMAMQSRFELVQQALEQSRNEYSELSSYLKTLIQMSKTVLSNNLKKEVSDEKALSYQPNDPDILH
jgi:hypothetical protein